MAASNTPKKSTTKRGTSAKKKSSARTQSKKNTAGKQSISSGFQTEIILLVLMAAAIILMVSCVGLGGNVGGSISKVLMGVMGLMAYIFPVVLFIMAAFLISNKGNVLAYKKTAAAAVLFLICCGLAQLFTEGYTESTTLAEYYRISSEYRTGGGAIGGAICISTISAFGTIGAYVIIVLVILVCLILITQHSFLGFLYKVYDKILEAVKGQQALYQEGAPERQLRKQLKVQQRQLAAQERREKRMQELEAALAEEGIASDMVEEPSRFEKKAAFDPSKSVFDMPAENANPDAENVGAFETTDIDGNAYTEKVFSDYDLTLVNCFTTWCSPCVNEMPDLDKLYQEMKEKGVGVVGMVIDSVGEDGTTDEDTVKKAQILKEKTGVTYPLLIPDAGNMNGRISGLSSFPESFFVDKDGNIVGEPIMGSRSLEDWKAAVEKQLEEIKAGK